MVFLSLIHETVANFIFIVKLSSVHVLEKRLSHMDDSYTKKPTFSTLEGRALSKDYQEVA